MARLLFKNGRVWDGEKFFYSDVLTDGEKVLSIAPEIKQSADFVYDASGKTVSAGLVDAHVHFKGISGGQFGINGEAVSFPFGVTAAADASAACGNTSIFDVIGLKMALFLNSKIVGNKADLTEAEEKLRLYGERAVGVKVYFDTFVSEVKDITPLLQIIEFAEKHGLIIMVHSSNSPETMETLLSTLRTGDIMTHAYHGGRHNVSEDGYECIKNARERGVIIDAGLAGNVHTDFSVFSGAIKGGFIPDIISSDITRFSAFKRGGKYGMTMCMSIARHLGMREEDIFKAVTSSPAAALNRPWGVLKEGGCADIAVLEYAHEGFDLTDNAGNRVINDMGYRCTLTVSDGEIVYKH